MKILSIIYLSLIILSCNSESKQINEVAENRYITNDVIEEEGLLYIKNDSLLVSGTVVAKDSIGRLMKEINYKNGLKHGSEIHYEYYESDLPVVVLEGFWTNGNKSGIWKLHEGEGRMAIIQNYNNNNKEKD